MYRDDSLEARVAKARTDQRRLIEQWRTDWVHVRRHLLQTASPRPRIGARPADVRRPL